jgi:hypothetical protein
MKKYFFIGLILVISTVGQAQDLGFLYDRSISFSWDVNLPLTNTGFINDVSIKGFRIGYRERITDRFYMGIDVNYAGYSDYAPRQTHYYDGGALTTDYYKYATVYGAMMTSEYLFRVERKVMPFLALGLGASHQSYSVYYNLYSQNDSGWGFLVRPEAGAIVKFGSRGVWGLISSVHFDYSSNKSDAFAYKNFTNLGFRTGLIFWLGSGSPF